MNFIASMKGVLQRMSLIKELRSLADIDIDVEGYQAIDTWLAIYQGRAPWLNYTLNNAGCQQNMVMKSLNMARVSCQKLSKKVWSEQCSINISDDTLQEFINDVLYKNNFTVKNTQFLESAFALGGGCYNPYVEDGKIMIDFVQAPNFIPTKWDNLTVKEGVFLDRSQKGDKYYTLITKHAWEDDVYVVTNDLYQSTRNDTLGVWVPLVTMYPMYEDRQEFANVDNPFFSYFKPNINNNLYPTSPLGVSIFANSLDSLQSIDEMYDSYYRDFYLGGKKVLVSASLMDTMWDNEGNRSQMFDTKRTVYQVFDTEVGDQNQLIQDNTLPLRVEEHIRGLNSQLDMFGVQLGFSTGSFSFDSQGQAVTATEVVSNQNDTYETMKQHELILEQSIKNLIYALINLGMLNGDLPTTYATADYEVNIVFDDSIIQDRVTDIDNAIKLTSSGLQSKMKAIMELFGLDEEQAMEEVTRINNENRMVTDINMYEGLE